MAKKCPTCNSCLDIIWIMPNRFLHCWLDDIYYDIVDGNLVIIPKDKLNPEIVNFINEEKSR